MTKSAIFSLVVLCTMSAFAKDMSAQVQCNPSGPIFNGTLSFPIELKAWKKESCQKYSSGNTYVVNFSSNDKITLKFNGLAYESFSARYRMHSFNCEPGSFWDYASDVMPLVYADLSENTSGYETQLEIDLSENGTIKGRIDSADESCVFKAK